MSERPRTFLEACLAGEALLTEVDDWVDAWHKDAWPGTDTSLDEFLGFNDQEGALWAERPEALRFIVASHQRGVPLLKIISRQDDWSLAARGGSDDDARGVLSWLRQHNRL
jgi:hypothetical protein